MCLCVDFSISLVFAFELNRSQNEKLSSELNNVQQFPILVCKIKARNYFNENDEANVAGGIEAERTKSAAVRQGK